MQTSISNRASKVLYFRIRTERNRTAQTEAHFFPSKKATGVEPETLCFVTDTLTLYKLL